MLSFSWGWCPRLSLSKLLRLTESISIPSSSPFGATTSTKLAVDLSYCRLMTLLQNECTPFPSPADTANASGTDPTHFALEEGPSTSKDDSYDAMDKDDSLVEFSSDESTKLLAPGSGDQKEKSDVTFGLDLSRSTAREQSTIRESPEVGESALPFR